MIFYRCDLSIYRLVSFQVITCGVSQESTLGPLLFIIYLNDLPLAVKDAEITIYADDTSLYKASKNIKELNETLVPAFSNICDWLKCNKLSLMQSRVNL